MNRLVSAALAVVVAATWSHAVNRVVAKTGGTYATIMAGLNAATAGDTVLVKAGTYSEIVTWPTSGSSSGGYIVLKAYGDGPAIISGQGLTASQNAAELVIIRSKSYAAIIGLEIGPFTTASGSIFLDASPRSSK